MKKAAKAKRRKPYKKAIAQTYVEQTPERRKAIRKNAAPLERKIAKKAEPRAKKRDKKLASQFGGGDFGPKRGARKPTSQAPRLNPQVSKAGFVPDAVINKKARTYLAKVGENAVREAVDIPANIIPTAAYLADPVIKQPGKPESYLKSAKRVGEATIELPKQLIKDPAGTFKEHPLSTALLVSPAGKIPIRSVRAVQRRIPGKERTPDIKELPGTNLKENRPTTTGYARNISRRVIPQKKPSETVNAKEVETRVDEDVSLMEGLTRREGSKQAKKVYKARKKEHTKAGMTKKDAKKLAGAEAAATAQKIEQTIRAEQKERLVDTIAITDRPKYRITSSGQQLVKEGTGKAQVFKTQKVADSVAKRAKSGDVEFHSIPYKGGYAVVPKVAMSGGIKGRTPGRWEEHTDPKTFSPAEAVTRMYSTQWRRNVLALHPTWYTGNVMEAALRAAVAGAGPASFYRGYKVPKELKSMDPVAARELGGRVYGGGHLAMQANLPREYELPVSGSGSLAKTIRAMQDLRKNQFKGKETKTGAITKNTINAWEGFSDFTMGTLSGGIEGFFQRGMLGKALSKDPIMDGHMIKVSKAAIEDAAKGLRNTENQVKMGRIVDEMYGRYGKWSPGMRRTIANYTPFISWTMNALNFLYRTLPRDHPVLVAAMASAHLYAQEWLKDQGLNKFAKGAVPAFLQGAVPSSEGFARYPTRYTPFAIASQFPEGIGDLILPQFSSSIAMMQHNINWKGQKLENPDGTPLDPLQVPFLAALTLLEGAIPASQQIQGATEKYEKGERNLGKLIKPRPLKEIPPKFDPFRKVPPPKERTSKNKSLFDSQEKQKSLFDSKSEQKSLFD